MTGSDYPPDAQERWRKLAKRMCDDLVSDTCRCDTEGVGPDRCGPCQLVFEDGAEHPPFKDAYLYAAALDGRDATGDYILVDLARNFEADPHRPAGIWGNSRASGSRYRPDPRLPPEPRQGP